MDDWHDITEAHRPAPADGQPRATLAFRRPGKGRPEVAVALNAPLVRAMGWTPGTTRLRVLLSPDRRRLALRGAEKGKLLRLHTNTTTASVAHALGWIEGPARPAAPVPHEARPDGTLVLPLPLWAQPPEVATTPPEAAPPAPAAPLEPAPPTPAALLPGSAPETRRLVAEAKAQASTNKRDRLTPEREALFRQLWPKAGIPVATILQRINALPGPGYGAPISMYSLATRLGLDPQRMAAEAAPPPKPVPAEVEDSDEREAEALIRADPNRGARWAAEEYGWPLDRAQRFVARVRRTMTAEEDAARAAHAAALAAPAAEARA